MAKTLKTKADEVGAKHGIDPEAITTVKKGSNTLIKVKLPNGREIHTDSVEGWEETLEKNIKKFKNKK